MGGSGNETTHSLRGENGDGRGQCWMGGSGNETTHSLRGENRDGQGQCWMGGSGNETTHGLRGENGDGQCRCWMGGSGNGTTHGLKVKKRIWMISVLHPVDTKWNYPHPKRRKSTRTTLVFHLSS